MSSILKFRKKPVEIEALRYRKGMPFQELRAFVPATRSIITTNAKGQVIGLELETLENWLIATDGDWIIKGVQGEFYPCKPEIFKKTYEAVP